MPQKVTVIRMAKKYNEMIQVSWVSSKPKLGLVIGNSQVGGVEDPKAM